ncbi:MAG TPA: hypothetical protein VFF64_15600 [Candidatus Eremiobacteraceae bacterium]|nr:hypothetical protein [Candidatus Eremiobacteraceae bacterium]
MSRCTALLAASSLAILALQTLGCGMSSSNSNRILQSMTISPAVADAQDFPDNQVQFTATGTFNEAPSPAQLTFMAPYTGSWGISSTSADVIATIDQTGLADCVSGAAGTVTVFALVNANSATGTGMTGVAVRGVASLTCP